MTTRFVVLDDIAFEAVTENGRPLVRTATKGEIVALTPKDAAALCARGAVRPATSDEAPSVIVTMLPPRQLQE